METLVIRQVWGGAELVRSARVIRDSFRTVAREFNLTRGNCPSHPSFISVAALRDSAGKMAFFGGFLGGAQVGFVALETATGTLYYMERLAVLPRHRHNGYGAQLVRFVEGRVETGGGKTISIGIIDESTVLKDWYRRFGFVETSTKRFSHLPFTVCYMEKQVQSGRGG